MNLADRGNSQKETPDALARRIAEQQGGVLHRDQALEVGLSRGQIERRLSSGRWLSALPSVYRLWPSPDPWSQFAHAAALWARDGILTHLAAARLQRLYQEFPFPIDVSFLRRSCRKSPTPSIRTHGSVSLLPQDVVKVEGIYVTSVARTILDVCDSCSPKVAEGIMEEAVRRRPSILSQLEDLLLGLGKGHRGAAVLRALVGKHPGVATGSPLELRFLRFLRRWGFPDPARQYEIYDRGGLIGRVDFAYPEHNIAIEVESVRWHSGRLQFDRDLERFNRLIAALWKPLRVTQAALRTPRSLAEQLRRLRTELLPGF